MKVRVPPALAGARLERAVMELFELPRGAVRRLCESGRVRLAGKRAKKGDPVAADDEIELQGGEAWLVPDASLEVPVLLERPDLLVVDKPRGIACHPLVPGEGGTLVDALVARFPEIAHASEEPREAGLVHRLDTDTSGCVLVARTRDAYARLRALFDTREPGTAARVGKRYVALVEGVVDAPLVVDLPIEHDARDPRRMRTGAGRPARTEITPIATGANVTAVSIAMDHGRRHQIRVHLAASGHPLVGDRLYGAAADAPGLTGHALHASSLDVPGVGRVVAPLPPALRAAAAALGCMLPPEAP